MKRRGFGTPKPTQAQLLAAMAIGGEMVRPPQFMSRKPRQSSGPRQQPEAKIQRAIVKYLAVCCPQILVASSLNGAHLKRGALAMMNAKTQGNLSGDPDLRLSLPGGRTVFLEVKSDKGRVSEAQMYVHNKLRALGFGVYVVRSIDDLRKIIKAENIPCIESS